MSLRRRFQSGFSLIELIVVMAIFAMLAMVGVPTLFTFMENSKIRTAAQNFYTAAQAAREEAVRRNIGTQLVLTSAAPTADSKDTATLTSTGPNWIVRLTTADSAVFDFVEGGSVSGTSTRADGATSVAVAASTASGAVTSVTFNPLSNTTLTQVATFAFTNPGGGACVAAAGPMQCLNVQIYPGGRIHLCDPTATGAADTRRCAS